MKLKKALNFFIIFLGVISCMSCESDDKLTDITNIYGAYKGNFVTKSNAMVIDAGYDCFAYINVSEFSMYELAFEGHDYEIVFPSNYTQGKNKYFFEEQQEVMLYWEGKFYPCSIHVKGSVNGRVLEFDVEHIQECPHGIKSFKTHYEGYKQRGFSLDNSN